MRSSRLAAVCAALLIAGTFVACSLFVDTDGLSTGADASTDSSTDASFDVISDHVDPVIDAGADANADASNIPYCQAHPGHTLCLDFDESTDLPNFSDKDFDPGAIFVDTSGGVSQPNSLSITFPASGGSEQIDQDYPYTNGGKLFISLDLKLASSDLSSGQLQPLAFNLPNAPGIASHYFYLQDYYGSVDESEAISPSDGGDPIYPSVTLASPIPNDIWMHVEMTVDETTLVKTVTLNGNVISTASAKQTSPSGMGNLVIGGFSDSLPASTIVHIDNLIVDY